MAVVDSMCGGYAPGDGCIANWGREMAKIFTAGRAQKSIFLAILGSISLFIPVQILLEFDLAQNGLCTWGKNVGVHSELTKAGDRVYKVEVSFAVLKNGQTAPSTENLILQLSNGVTPPGETVPLCYSPKWPRFARIGVITSAMKPATSSVLARLCLTLVLAGILFAVLRSGEASPRE